MEQAAYYSAYDSRLLVAYRFSIYRNTNEQGGPKNNYGTSVYSSFLPSTVVKVHIHTSVSFTR